MKKLVVFILSILVVSGLKAQITYPIATDTLRIFNLGGASTNKPVIKILNRFRDSTGYVLQNVGNGNYIPQKLNKGIDSLRRSGVNVFGYVNGIAVLQFKDSVGTAGGPTLANTDFLPEGSVNLYYTNTRVRNAVSATGLLTYNPSTGQFGIGITGSDTSRWNSKTKIDSVKATNDSTLVIYTPTGNFTTVIKGRDVKTIYNSDGSIPGTRTINFQNTGIMTWSNMLGMTLSGARYGIQGQLAHVLLQHFETDGNQQNLYLGNIAHEGTRWQILNGSNSIGISMDTLNRLMINGLKNGGTSADSFLVIDPATGIVRMRSALTGAGITQLTGDGTAGPGTGSQVFTLSNTGVTPGIYTNANVIVDAKGRITAISNGSAGGLTGANQGLSASGAFVQLGQLPSASGNPAAITTNREIPIGSNSLTFIDGSNTNSIYSTANILVATNKVTQVAAGSMAIFGDSTGGSPANILLADANGSGPQSVFRSFKDRLEIEHGSGTHYFYKTGDVRLGGGGSSTDNGHRLTIGGDAYIMDSLTIGKVSTGIFGDSLLVIRNGAVFKVSTNVFGGVTTLYNGNGTLSSARTVTMAGNSLSFLGGKFITEHTAPIYTTNQTASTSDLGTYVFLDGTGFGVNYLINPATFTNKTLYIKCINATNTVKITLSSGTIDGFTEMQLLANDVRAIWSNGTNLFIVSN